MNRMGSGFWSVALAIVGGECPASALAGESDWSVARQWNEQNLAAIRVDYARPTVHARNLFHVSLAMYDAWAAYDEIADPWLLDEQGVVGDYDGDLDIDEADRAASRNEAISFAAYRVLKRDTATRRALGRPSRASTPSWTPSATTRTSGGRSATAPPLSATALRCTSSTSVSGMAPTRRAALPIGITSRSMCRCCPSCRVILRTSAFRRTASPTTYSIQPMAAARAAVLHRPERGRDQRVSRGAEPGVGHRDAVLAQ